MYFKFCSKLITIEEHCQKFQAKVLEMQGKKGKNRNFVMFLFSTLTSTEIFVKSLN